MSFASKSSRTIVDFVVRRARAVAVKRASSSGDSLHVIVGTLVVVGSGELAPDDVARILASRDRTQAGATAPPQGLCLVAVSYE